MVVNIIVCLPGSVRIQKKTLMQTERIKFMILHYPKNDPIYQNTHIKISLKPFSRIKEIHP